MMPMDPKKLINLFSWKHSPSAVLFSYLHFADIIVGFNGVPFVSKFSFCGIYSNS